jgi:hypothetical protein
MLKQVPLGQNSLAGFKFNTASGYQRPKAGEVGNQATGVWEI